MAVFKVKDLMINLAPEQGAAGGALARCVVISDILSRFPCGCGCTYGYTIGCGPTMGCGASTVFMAQLAAGAAGGVGLPLPCVHISGCAGGTIVCGGCTYIVSQCVTGSCFTGSVGCLITFYTPTICPGATVIGPVPVPPEGDPAAASEQLAALKTQLAQALAEIEKQQAAAEESLKPQTVAQVEELQSKMREALAELERRKKELGGK
jgi:hypothetical protein